jgi:hypothetical protein
VTRSPRRAARRPGARGTPARSRGVRHGERLVRAPRARGELHARRHARRHRPQGEGGPATPASAEPLERCIACGADFVLPVEWTEAGTRHWWMRLRCAACDDTREVAVGDGAAQQFDVALDRGLHTIRKALEIAERERMTADVDTMIAALRRDLIDASDFAR